MKKRKLRKKRILLLIFATVLVSVSFTFKDRLLEEKPIEVNNTTDVIVYEEPVVEVIPVDPLEEFIDLAINYALNEPENPIKNGETKYGALFGTPRSAWCTEFVIWSFKQAEIELGTSYLKNIYPYVDSANAAINWYTKRDRYHKEDDYIPSRGDLIFFNHYNKSSISDHTGLVIDVVKEDGKYYVITIEGNIPTDKVKTIRQRKLPLDSSIILGYGSYK